MEGDPLVCLGNLEGKEPDNFRRCAFSLSRLKTSFASMLVSWAGDRPKACCVKYVRLCAQVHASYQVI